MSIPSNLNVVVEGKSDAAILRAVLGTKLTEGVDFYAAGGSLALATVGRNLLVHEGGPVLVVMDADTLNPQQARQLQSLTRVALGHVAQEDNFQVFAFLPEIEVLFFEAPEALERLLEISLTPEQIQEGLLYPTKTLLTILKSCPQPQDLNTFVASLDDLARANLLTGKQAQSFLETMETLRGSLAHD